MVGFSDDFYFYFWCRPLTSSGNGARPWSCRYHFEILVICLKSEQKHCLQQCLSWSHVALVGKFIYQSMHRSSIVHCELHKRDCPPLTKLQQMKSGCIQNDASHHDTMLCILFKSNIWRPREGIGISPRNILKANFRWKPCKFPAGTRHSMHWPFENQGRHGR